MKEVYKLSFEKLTTLMLGKEAGIREASSTLFTKIEFHNFD